MPLIEHHPVRPQKPRRRNRRSPRWRKALIAHRFNAVEGALALVAISAALWLLWPGPQDRSAQYASDWEESLLLTREIPAESPGYGFAIVPSAAASVSVSSKLELVSHYGQADPLRMRPRLAKIARTMPAIGLGPGAVAAETRLEPIADLPKETATEAPLPAAPAPRADEPPIEVAALPSAAGDSAEPAGEGPARAGGGEGASGPAPANITFEEKPFEIVALPPYDLERPLGALSPETELEALERLEAKLRPAVPSPPTSLTPPRLDTDRRPAWLRYAVAPPPLDGRPMIAIVVDDLGLNQVNTAALNDLKAPLTLAFLPYADGLGRQTRAAQKAGHELLVHMPMEPIGEEWPGPDALLVGLDPGEFERRLLGNLEKFEGYVGINNHMGSQLTQDRERMRVVMAELDKRELLFLDSKTSPLSIAANEAQSGGVPFAIRDVFLDNEPDVDAILRQLRATERVARRHSSAIAIAHPYEATIEALEIWLPTLEQRGFTLVPLSTVVARRACIDGLLADGCAPFGLPPARIASGDTPPRS